MDTVLNLEKLGENPVKVFKEEKGVVRGFSKEVVDEGKTSEKKETVQPFLQALVPYHTLALTHRSYS